MTEQKNAAKNLDQRMLAFVDPIGRLLTDGFHILALFAIGAATVWAAAAAFYAMVQKGSATIEDLLLLFIYLEIGSMVGIYFRTNHMPVRFLLYVGITRADPSPDRLCPARGGRGRWSAHSGERHSHPRARGVRY